MVEDSEQEQVQSAFEVASSLKLASLRRPFKVQVQVQATVQAQAQATRQAMFQAKKGWLAPVHFQTCQHCLCSNLVFTICGLTSS